MVYLGKIRGARSDAMLLHRERRATKKLFKIHMPVREITKLPISSLLLLEVVTTTPSSSCLKLGNLVTSKLNPIY